MKDWKVLIVQNEKHIEVVIRAVSYSDAYIKTELQYPDCLIKSIKLIND